MVIAFILWSLFPSEVGTTPLKMLF